MHVISLKRLRQFWSNPQHPNTEAPLRWWYQQVKDARWASPADVKATFNTVDPVGNKMVFDVAGHRCRVIAWIDYERHKVFIRFVLDHKEYDRGQWKTDPFGDASKKQEGRTPNHRGDVKTARRPPRRRKRKKQDGNTDKKEK